MTAALEEKRNAPLMPIPVVVDACVLLSNVGYALRKQHHGALLSSASGHYSLASGVILFTTPEVVVEVERNLRRIAAHERVPEAAARSLWDEQFRPRLRIVDVGADSPDARVAAVRALHANDAPTAALAVLLAPCVLLTDNRKHFEPLGLPDRPVNEIALDIYKVSELMTGTNGVVLAGGLTGAGVLEGSKKIVGALGKEGALVVALLLLGAVYLYWRSEPGSRLRRNVAAAARDVGPPLLEAVSERLELSEKIAALAIEPAHNEQTALRDVAQELATRRSMTTTEIVELLKGAGYLFDSEASYPQQVRAWLKNTPAFFELARGHWALGYHPLPRAIEAA